MTRINHLVDPTFFYDVIEEFAFDYDIYIEQPDGVDDYGNTKINYKKERIRGSLQVQGKPLRQSKSGNTMDVQYMFYCKSLYRIDIGDIIEYDNNFLRCIDVHPYDEYGVREARLQMIQLTAYRDFADYIKFIKGQKIV